MSATRLKRKVRKNSTIALTRVKNIKRLTAMPTIKKVDVEAIKKSFEENAAKA
jgi:hypothetical protein